MVNTAKNFFDHAKQSSTNALKTNSEKVIQKTAERNGDLIVNKIANKITNVLQISQKNNSEAVTNENDKIIPKGRYVSPEERQKIINEMRLI